MKFRRIMDDDDPYDDDTGISNKEWLETEAEYDLLIEQPLCSRVNKDKNDDKEEVDEETVVGDNGANDGGDSNNNDNEVHIQPVQVQVQVQVQAQAQAQVQVQVQVLQRNDDENDDDDGGDYNNHDSDCGICEKDGDDDNNDDEYNIIQDAEYYDNTGNYSYDNTENYTDDLA